MRVLVTGATGFIGRHCLAKLETDAAIEVHAVNLSGPSAGTRAIWHVAELRDGAAARQLIRAVRPTHLLHCAWVATPGVYLTSPDNLTWLRSSIELFDEFGIAGGRRVVGVGTSAEYRPGATPCREDETRLEPASLYGKCKLACAAALAATADAHRFSMVWARLFLPYGPGDSPRRLIPSLLNALADRQPFPMSDGEQARDFIWAPDAGDLLVRLLKGETQGAFNVGTGVGATIRSVAQMIASQLQADDCLCIGALPMRPGEPPFLVADMHKVERCFGECPNTRLHDGLAQLIASAALKDRKR